MIALSCLAPAGSPAGAITYNPGDVIYVAYKNNPSGAEYIVDLGPVSLFTAATTTFTLTGPTASDLNTIVGATAPNIFVGLFGVLDPNNQDALFAANGPKDDFALLNSSFIGAVQQVESFGDGLASFGSAVPSGALDAVSFPSAEQHSYQASLNGSFQGSLGGNVAWNVEARLSSGTGIRIATPLKIHAYTGQNNPVAGTSARQCIGFFTLNGDGTISYSPDHDCNFIPDDTCTGGGAACSTGQPGACAAGTQTCASGSLQCVPNVSASSEICDNLDNDCDGIVDDFATSCGLGACASTGTCTAGADSCVPGTPAAETCDGIDNNCDGSLDEGNPGGGGVCSTALPGICAAGTTSCQNGGLRCAPDHAPRTETCNALDDDCDGVTDDVAGPACTLFGTAPVEGDVLDCSSPRTIQPTISWNAAQYDKFKVFINTNSGFVAAKGITSGKSLLKTTSWHVPKAAWVSLCRKATNGGGLFIKIHGIDVDVPAKDPLKRFFSPVVPVTARK